MATSAELPRRPEARTESVEDLVDTVLRGEVRIPVFQRGLAWEPKHVLELFDSIYRGYPIGALLLQRGPAEAGLVRIGPLEVVGHKTSHALWVIDGQQRLTSLAAGLRHPEPLPETPRAGDPYVVYFDVREQAFCAPPRDGKVPTHWVPLPKLLSASELSEWVFQWPHQAEAPLRAVLFEAGKRLREYKVPAYVIDTDREDVLRDIFHRVNSSGKKLTWPDVYNALYGHKGAEPASLAALAASLEALGMGLPEEESQLLPCLVAIRGLDVTRSFGEHVREQPARLEGVASEAAPVLRQVLGFLRSAEIPHLRLLPTSTSLPVLTRFFKLHPEPNERSLTLLTRWLWRGFVAPLLDDRALRRNGVAAITADDEEGSVQALLAQVGAQPPALFCVEDFDARSAHSRLAMLGLGALRPQAPPSLPGVPTSPVDVAELLRSADRDAFRFLLPSSSAAPATRSEANRILLAGAGSAKKEVLELINAAGPDHPFLRSHAISPACAEALRAGRAQEAIALRAASLEASVTALVARLAEWGANDRPSIEYVLARAGGA